MNNAKKSLVPHRRFKEFQNAGAWEQRKLGDVAVIFDGTHQTPKYTDSGIKFVSVENIATLETEKYISQKAYENEYSNKQAEKGDILMTRIGNIGTAKMIEKDEPLAYYVTLALLKPQNIDSNFLVWGISSPEVQRNIWKLTLHIAFPKKINLGEISQVTINIPSSSEQKKIGEFFQQLDSLIALHQRKLNKLKKLKSAYLTEMFPDEGEHKPKRRFAGFTDDWEQRKLGDVVERFDNLRIPVTSSKRKRGITPYYGANGIQDYVQGYTHDGEFVLVAEDGANDLQNYPIHYVNGKVWVNNHAHVLQGKKDIADNLFLVNAIKRIKFETYLVGGSRAKLNADVMMKLPIKMPKLNEQQKLGKYFSRIDTLIALHQRKIDKLQKLKNAYLNEMFV